MNKSEISRRELIQHLRRLIKTVKDLEQVEDYKLEFFAPMYKFATEDQPGLMQRKHTGEIIIDVHINGRKDFGD